MSCCTSINGTCVRTDDRRDRDWPPAPGTETRLQPGITLRQLTQALRVSRDEAGDWESALRHFNPLTFDECGSARADAPATTYIPTEQEVRELRFFGPAEDPCACPDDAPAEDDSGPLLWDPSVRLAYDERGYITVEPALDRPRELADLTPEDRAAALRRLAAERGLDPETVRWNPTLGTHVEIDEVRPAGAPYGIDEITPAVSNEELWQIVERQGGLVGIEITDQVRASPRYQQVMSEEHARLTFELVAPMIPSRGVARTRVGSLQQNQESLLTNVFTDRPTADQILETERQRADVRMTYELALERLGR